MIPQKEEEKEKDRKKRGVGGEGVKCLNVSPKSGYKPRLGIGFRSKLETGRNTPSSPDLYVNNPQPGCCTGPWTSGPRAKLVTHSPLLQWPWAAGHPHGRPKEGGGLHPEAIREQPAQRPMTADSSGP